MSEPSSEAGEFPALSSFGGNAYRDAWCGQMLADRVGAEARVAGWVNRRRDHGGLIFIDLRDRTGIVQLVFDPDDADAEAFALGHKLRSEDVLTVAGKRRRARRRASSTRTSRPAPSRSAWPRPSCSPTPRRRRSRSRAGAARRARTRACATATSTCAASRCARRSCCAPSSSRRCASFLDGEGFLEIETPVLTRSTPEGARDFLVPARLRQGSFYALPQSPQLFKQLLMVSGFERYYQVARCFRDEDLRADRQPDFTQLDIEMSFVDGEDVIDANERLIKHVLAAAGVEVELPLRRICYDEAMGRYGSDKPDLRFGMELVDVSETLAETEFKVFRGTIDGGGVVKGINCGKREVPRKELDDLIAQAQELGAKGLVWAFCEENGTSWRSPTAKFLTTEELTAINEQARRLRRRPAARSSPTSVETPTRCSAAAHAPRRAVGPDPGEGPGAHSLCWIVDWPMFDWDEGASRWNPLHHPFTAPEGELDDDDPGAALTQAYDMVWNGWEIGGGSIRISDAGAQERVLALLGIDARRGARPASASCSRRCATAPRRTAASPTASTGSRRSPPAPTRSAT